MPFRSGVGKAIFIHQLEVKIVLIDRLVTWLSYPY